MEDNLKAVLTTLASAREDVNLLNTYKGVPLIFAAPILEVGLNSIRVATDTCQVVSMVQDKRTYLQSPRLPDVLSAVVESFDSINLVTTLVNITRMNVGIGKRNSVRVHPAEAIRIHLRNKSGFFGMDGQIHDISREGIGLFVGWGPGVQRYFSPGAAVVFQYQLPGVFFKPHTRPMTSRDTEPLDRFATENTRFSTTPGRESLHGSYGKEATGEEKLINPIIESPAEVVNLYQEIGLNRFRIGLHVTGSSVNEKYIMSYISQRQSEIIHEIRECYQMMIQGRSAFYFSQPYP